jgi:ATP/maltotriose-dependent transcriptional regulator MalT
MKQATAMERGVIQARCSLVLGEAQVLAGRLEEAHAIVEGALALARAHQERSNVTVQGISKPWIFCGFLKGKCAIFAS